MGIKRMYWISCDDCLDEYGDEIYGDTSADVVRQARAHGFRCLTKKNFGEKPTRIWRCENCRELAKSAPKGFVVIVKFSERGEVKSRVRTYAEADEMRRFVLKNYPDRELTITTADGRAVGMDGKIVEEEADA